MAVTRKHLQGLNAPAPVRLADGGMGLVIRLGPAEAWVQVPGEEEARPIPYSQLTDLGGGALVEEAGPERFVGPVVTFWMRNPERWAERMARAHPGVGFRLAAVRKRPRTCPNCQTCFLAASGIVDCPNQFCGAELEIVDLHGGGQRVILRTSWRP